MPAKWTDRLLIWYRRNRRDLPWRRTKDPYAIWVSEIMLQQTTVEAVIPYYERFLKRFPTVKALAAADEEEVLRLWSGLGYYSRARNLHKAARMTEKIPDTVEELMRLPGIGRYTAGAIASIAFNRRVPIVDGNVIRVLSRLFAIPDDPKSSEGLKKFWKKAEEVLPRGPEGEDGERAVSPYALYSDFNQALMELGATVCSPENPVCRICPVAGDCRARKEARVEEFPTPKKKVEYRDVLMSAAVVQSGGRILFLRRPETGLLKGLWELPMVEGDASELQKRWGVLVLKPLPSVRHSVLNRRLKIAPFLCTLKDQAGRTDVGGLERRWLTVLEAVDLATSSMNRKILKHLKV